MKALWIPALLLLASTADADVVFKMKMTSQLPEKAERTGTFYLGAKNLAYEFDSGDPSGMTGMIFRADKQVLWIINAADKEYTELDKAQLDEIAAKVGGAMAMMQEKLKDLPPEQRKMIEESMGQIEVGGKKADAELTTKKTGESRKISGFDCSRYDVYLSDEVVSTLWAAPAAKLGLSEADLQPMRDLSKLFESLTEQFPMAQELTKGGLFTEEGLSLIDGFPLLSQEMNEGKVVGETLVESIEHHAIDSRVFELPAGLSKRDMVPKD